MCIVVLQRQRQSHLAFDRNRKNRKEFYLIHKVTFEKGKFSLNVIFFIANFRILNISF